MRRFVLMEDKEYSIPKNINESFLVLDEIFNESKEDQEWFKSAEEEDAVTSLHNGLGRWIRNTWGFWTKDTEIYTVLKNMGLWHADDMYSIIMTSYHRKINGKELNLKEQIQHHINYWKDYEKINGPVEKE
jgi:hypothetical protein